MDKSRYVSLWMEATSAAMTLIEATCENIVAIAAWQSSTRPLDASFPRKIEIWHQENAIDRVMVNAIADVEDDAHPARRLMRKLFIPIEVKPAILPIEGLAAFQEKKDTIIYEGVEQVSIEEAMPRQSFDEPRVMSFLQAIAHEVYAEAFIQTAATYVHPYGQTF